MFGVRNPMAALDLHRTNSNHSNGSATRPSQQARPKTIARVKTPPSPQHRHPTRSRISSATRRAAGKPLPPSKKRTPPPPSPTSRRNPHETLSDSDMSAFLGALASTRPPPPRRPPPLRQTAPYRASFQTQTRPKTHLSAPPLPKAHLFGVVPLPLPLTPPLAWSGCLTHASAERAFGTEESG